MLLSLTMCNIVRNAYNVRHENAGNTEYRKPRLNHNHKTRRVAVYLETHCNIGSKLSSNAGTKQLVRQ